MQVVTFDYGMKSSNPIDSVLFYKKEDPDTAIRISKEEVGSGVIYYVQCCFCDVQASTRIPLVIVLPLTITSVTLSFAKMKAKTQKHSISYGCGYFTEDDGNIVKRH